jgi:hypothetical protein
MGRLGRRPSKGPALALAWRAGAVGICTRALEAARRAWEKGGRLSEECRDRVRWVCAAIQRFTYCTELLVACSHARKVE